MAKKLKKFLKKAAKAALIGGALYAGAKGLKARGLKGNVSKTAAMEDANIKAPLVDAADAGRKFKKIFKHPPYDAGADTSTYFKSGGRTGKKDGGRTGKQFGGGLNRAVARRDMRSGYYPSDMGMRGGTMYKKGGRVKSMGKATRGGGVAKR